MNKLALVAAAVSLVAACRKEPRFDAPPPAHTAPAGLPPSAAAPPPAAAPHAAPQAAPALAGTVRERIDAPPYSYLRLETAAGEKWAAVNQTTVAVGAPVEIANPMEMENFESKTLKRRFDRIIFGTIAETQAPPQPHHGTPSAAAAADVKVEKASGADAATIGDVFSRRAELADRRVTVRGKVVKWNGGIMGKNWMHLQDGTGTATAGDHDLTVSTTGDAQVGDVVTVRGAVHLDRDFGAGYKYAVIIEDAEIVR